MIEYHVDMLPQFQYILDKNGKIGKFGGWLRVSTTLVENPVIFLGQDKEIFKHNIITRKMLNQNVK